MTNKITRVLSYLFLFAPVFFSSCGSDDLAEKPPADTFRKDTSLNIVSQTGTLEIDPFLPANGPGSDYWIYIDKTLVEIQKSGDRRKFSVQLIPGEYTVEIAVYCYPRGYSFPFTFRSGKVTVSEGETALIRLNAETDPTGVMLLGGTAIEPGETWEAWANRLNQRVTETGINMFKTPEMIALNQAANIQPLRNRIFLDLPDRVGGGREYDADQVRLIVNWVWQEQWESWLPGPQYGMPDDIRAFYDRINANVTMYRNEVYKYNVIADRLEKLKE